MWYCGTVFECIYLFFILDNYVIIKTGNYYNWFKFYIKLCIEMLKLIIIYIIDYILCVLYPCGQWIF